MPEPKIHPRMPQTYHASMDPDRVKPLTNLLYNLGVEVENVAFYSFESRIRVVFTVQKIDDNYCTVICSMLSNKNFKRVIWEKGYSYNGSNFARFETKMATDFSSIEHVKSLLLSNADFPDNFVVYDKNITVFDSGEYLRNRASVPCPPR